MHDHILPAARPLMPQLLAHRVSVRRAANLAFLACLFLTGCAETPFVRSSLPIEKRDKTHEAVMTGQMHEDRRTAFYQTPPPAAAEKNSAGNAPPPTNLKKGGEKGVTLNLQSMPLPEFVNAVFGAVLKLNVSIDPQVAQRTDMVSLRSGAPMDADQIFAAAQAVLRSYGIAAQEFNGLVRVVPENSQSGYLPEIRRGRAMPDVPESLRPVFFLVELEHTQSTQAVTWLRTLFGNRLTATEDARRNMILLSGQSDAIRTALEAIQLLDQPQMRGRYSVRIAPVFWSAEELARRLVDLLTAEGYAASTLSSSPSPVLVVPVAPINSVIVFAANQQILEHTLHWAQELDQTPPSRSGGYITYHVRNVDAADLAATLAQVMGESTATSEPAAAAPVPAAPGGTAVPGGAAATPASSAVRQNPSSRVVVNKAGNSIIIKTTPAEYQQWYGLLQELDRPARAALVMATIAEIRLNKSDTFGFNWMLQQFQLHGHNVSTGTAAALPKSSSVEVGTLRFALATLKGDPRALLHALSKENRIKVLSNPSLMARNGETATIQVGTDVPILSSQITTPVGNAGGAANPPSVASLQTVQYRQTGVMLKVKPVIHAGGRIEIDVTQEVSLVQAATSESGAQKQQNLTPPVLSRKIDTKVSVADGNTIVLGGLIQEDTSEGNAGIPFLKDIPYLGALFRTSMAKAVDRTELIVLLTPYVVEDDFDANAITDTFRNQFSWAQEIKPKDLSTKNTDGDALTENAVQPPAPVERRPVPGSEASGGTGSEAGNGAGSAGSAGLADTGGSRRFSGGFGEAGAQGAQNSAAPTAVPTTRLDAGATPDDAPPPSYRSRPYHLTDLSEAKNAAQNARRRSANAVHEQSRIFVPPDDLPKTGASDKSAAAASGAASSAARSTAPAARRSAASGAPASGQRGASGQQGAATTTPAGTSANAPAGTTRNASAGASTNTAAEGGRKPVTDEAMKKELLELMRGAGGAGAAGATGASSGTSSGK